MKIISNKRYKELTAFPINYSTDYTNLTQDEMYEIFDKVCSSVSLTDKVSKYFYQMQQNNNPNYINYIRDLRNFINGNSYSKISRKMNELEKKYNLGGEQH